MKPGSPAWNDVAYRSDFERRGLSYFPQSFKTWFTRSEKELLNSHEFRGVMLEYASIEEWWRVGELRWNRKLWFPYVRILQWSLVPLFGILFYVRFKNKPGSPMKNTKEDWKREYDRWKASANSGDFDEYYTFMYNESKLFTKPPETIVKQAPSVEKLQQWQSKTFQGQADQMLMQKFGGLKASTSTNTNEDTYTNVGTYTNTNTNRNTRKRDPTLDAKDPY